VGVSEGKGSIEKKDRPNGSGEGWGRVVSGAWYMGSGVVGVEWCTVIVEW